MKYKFVCPIFGIRVYLVIGDKKQLKAFHCYEIDFYDAETHFVEVEHVNASGLPEEGIKSSWLLVWINKDDDYHAMVHETVHLVKRIFGIMGIAFDETNDEMIAYYQNYWVRKFWNKMSKSIREK
jgi:hypothetical protein